MNSLIRKVAAGVLAAVTMLGIAGLGASTANADATTTDNATLTVSTKDAKYAGKTISAYQMFSATVSGSDDTADKSVAYTLNSDWEGFFKSADVLNKSDLSGADLSDAAYKYVAALKDTDTNKALTNFSKSAANWAQKKVSDNKPTIAATKSGTVPTTADADGNYSVAFSGLNYGYYLVAVDGVTVVSDAESYATLINVTSAATTATIKGTLPTVDKKVADADTTTAQIGKELTFTLNSTVPDMSNYDKYTFNFKDVLSNGLTFTAGSVSVTIDGQTVTNTNNDQYTVTEPSTTNNNTLTVQMNDFKTKHGTDAGKSIVVTYKAALNENAVIGDTGNLNTATLEYSNNPSTGGTGTSVPDKVYTYTYGFTIDKYTGDEYNADAKRLPGAEFQVKAKDAKNYTKFVVKEQGDATKATTYRAAKTDTESGATDTLVTPASGKIVIQGLAKGNYVVHEKTAPKGYNTLSKDFGVHIEGTEPNDGTDSTVTVKYNEDSTGANYDKTAANGVIPVKNTSGALLPETGGMGTVLFTVFGVAIVALGAAWYVKSNRKSRHTA